MFARTDPRRYFETVGPQRADRAEAHQPLQPVVRALHAFETLEPPADASCAVPC